MARKTDFNNELRFTISKVIEKFARVRDEPLNSTIFHKAISIINKELKEKEYEIKLPHCWYLYGDEVAASAVQPLVNFYHGPTAKTTVQLLDTNPPDLSDQDSGKVILQTIDEVYNRFRDTPNIRERLINEVYDYAPFEFQRDFKKFREDLESAVYEDTPTEEFIESFFIDRLSEVKNNFPASEFSEIQTSFQKYNFLASTYIKRAELEELLVLSEKFWKLYCKFLRVHDQGQENIDDELLSKWERRAIEEIDEFDSLLTGELLNLKSEGFEPDPLIETWFLPFEGSATAEAPHQ